MRVSRWFAAQLETGSFRGYPGAHVLSKAYEAVASTRLARPVTLPARVRVVGVGSAVLGGAGKTLVAIAYARRLAQAGMRVSFVGHGYGAHPREARCCEGDETVLEIAMMRCWRCARFVRMKWGYGWEKTGTRFWQKQPQGLM